MCAAKWDREFVATLAAERARLEVAKVVRIRWLAAAYETGLSGNMAEVLSVAISARRANHEHAFIHGLIPFGTRRLRPALHGLLPGQATVAR